MSKVQTTMAEETPPSQLVVETIAEADSVDPVDLDSSLYEAIDPDALDQIFAATPLNGRMDGEVTFPYEGYDVTVSGDGYVSVEERSR